MKQGKIFLYDRYVFNCKVDLVRFRKSLRPLLQANIKQEAVYV